MFYRKSKAKKLLISHHAPERDDKELDIMSNSVLPKGVFFAKENKTIKDKISEEELVELFEENYHTKNTDFIFNRVFKDE